MSIIRDSFIFSIFLFITFLLVLNFDILLTKQYMFISYELFNPYYDMFVALIWFVVFSLVVFLFMRKELLYVWLIKSFITLIFMLFYESVYQLDAYLYFSSAVDISNTTFTGGNSLVMAYFNYYLTYIFGESYQSLKLFHSFIGFIGLVILFKTLEMILKDNGQEVKYWYLYLFFLFPTSLFWTSILGKDPISLFWVALVCFSFINFIRSNNKNYKFLLILFFALAGLFFLRYWFVGIILFSIILYYLHIYLFRRNWYILLFLLILSSIIVSNIDNSYTNYILDRVNAVNASLSSGVNSVGKIYYSELSDYFYYLLPNMFTTLFRPLIFDISNVFTLLAACENIILLLFVVKYIVFNISNIIKSKYIVFFLFYIFSWLLFYVMVSPGNFGAAVRFKLQVLPVILIIIGYSIHISNKKCNK